MARRPLDRFRLFVNFFNLAASLLLTAGAVWAVASGSAAGTSFLARLYAPVVRAGGWYWSLGLVGKAAALLAAAAALMILVAALMLSFKLYAEDWAVMILGAPFYLLVACVIFLTAGLVGSVIGQIVG